MAFILVVMFRRKKPIFFLISLIKRNSQKRLTSTTTNENQTVSEKLQKTTKKGRFWKRLGKNLSFLKKPKQ